MTVLLTSWEPRLMRMFRRRRTDPRNILFDAGLEFGKNWRRDLRELADERLPHLSEDDRFDLAGEIDSARTAIEGWIWKRWEGIDGRWRREDSGAAEAFIRAAYPWMDDRNISRSISQGCYYAWHG